MDVTASVSRSISQFPNNTPLTIAITTQNVSVATMDDSNLASDKENDVIKNVFRTSRLPMSSGKKYRTKRTPTQLSTGKKPLHVLNKK